MKRFLIFVGLLFWACSFGNIEERTTYKNAIQKNRENQNIQTEKKEVDGCLIVKTLNTFGKEEFENAGFEVKGMLSVPNSDFLYWNMIFLHLDFWKEITKMIPLVRVLAMLWT